MDTSVTKTLELEVPTKTLELEEITKTLNGIPKAAPLSIEEVQALLIGAVYGDDVILVLNSIELGRNRKVELVENGSGYKVCLLEEGIPVKVEERETLAEAMVIYQEFQ